MNTRKETSEQLFIYLIAANIGQSIISSNTFAPTGTTKSDTYKAEKRLGEDSRHSFISRFYTPTDYFVELIVRKIARV